MQSSNQIRPARLGGADFHLFTLTTPQIMSTTKENVPAETTPAEGLNTTPFIVLTEGTLENQRDVLRGYPFFIEIPMQSLDK